VTQNTTARAIRATPDLSGSTSAPQAPPARCRRSSLDVYRQSQPVDTASVVSNPEFSDQIPLETQRRICTDSWAIRHRFLHLETGTIVPASCGRYACLHCGPIRVEQWRSVIERAEPERFITLSRVGLDLYSVSRVATQVVRRLRRNGYQFDYCLTFEKHKNGYFHLHMLQKGDFIPQTFLSDCLRSATHGLSWVTDIRRCKPGSAGYVTKYCTKMLQASEQGTNEQGMRHRVNRVRYSRGFFGAPVSELREQIRKEWLESKGDELVELDGSWIMEEAYPLPRDPEDGHVNLRAAQEQHRMLVQKRYDEVSGQPERASGGKILVFRYMVGIEEG
jgi:hypothetical protein